MEGFAFVLYYSNMRSTAPAPAIRVYNIMIGERRRVAAALIAVP